MQRVSYDRAALLRSLKAAFIHKSERGSVLANGASASWIYDFRPTVLDGESLDRICDALWDLLEQERPFQIGGLETTAIALVSGMLMKGVQHEQPLTGFYVRKSRRKDGLQQQIEGNLTGEKIILIDDVLNSSRSFMRQIKVLEEAGRVVHAVCAIIRYREESFYEYFRERGIRVFSLFTLDDFPESGGVEAYGKKHPAPAYRERFSVDWKFESAQPSYFHIVPKSAPVIDEGRLYFGADNGTLWALDQRDGSVAWQFHTLFGAGDKRIFSSPALNRGTLYFGSYDGNVYALDAATGKKKWVYREADWIGSSPTVAPDLGVLFIGLEFGLWNKRGGIAALDLATGEKRWWRQVETYVHSSPGYSARSDTVVVGSSSGTVYAFRGSDGAALWTFKTGGAVRAGLAMDDERGCVCFGSEDRHVYLLRIKDGVAVHRIETLEPVYSTPTLENGIAYMGLLDKRIVAIDMDAGSLKWEYWTHSRVFATPAVIEGHVFCGSNDGRLYELDASTGAEIAFLQTTERIVNKIAFNPRTEKIFLPTYANEIYCLSRKHDS